jgi:hypothetical protein
VRVISEQQLAIVLGALAGTPEGHGGHESSYGRQPVSLACAF